MKLYYGLISMNQLGKFMFQPTVLTEKNLPPMASNSAVQMALN